MDADINIPACGIIGKDFLNPRGCIVNLTTMDLTIPEINTSIKIFPPFSNPIPTALNCLTVTNNSDRNSALLKSFQEQTTAESDLLSPLILKYSDVFHLENERLSINNFFQYNITLNDRQPVYEKNYRTPFSQKSEIDRQVDLLLKNGQIEKCISPYNSPAILVPKKSQKGVKSWRLCIDYRSVNKKLTYDTYPLPRIDDVLDSLGNNKFFSTIDLAQGFHQIPLTNESKNLTTFSTTKGSFRWNVLPFGLKVCPSAFARMINAAFAHVSPQICFIYLDDIIIIGRTAEEHIGNIEKVFQICRQLNLKINPKKCVFFKNKLTYLGHQITDTGVLPDDSKYDSIRNYPQPNSKEEVKRFVAFANYYRRFIKNFAALAKSLNNLTRKNSEFIWSNECDKSFKYIKSSLMTPPILKYPDFTQRFKLTVDASNYACGAVLSQCHNDFDHPIAFASKSFTKGEINKSTIEKELLAIYYAIKHFHPYIFGTHFTIKSDHRPLVYLFSLKDPTSRLTRIRLLLEEYDFSVEYIKGQTNAVADALSRINISELKDLNVFVIRTFPITRSMTRKNALGQSNSASTSVNLPPNSNNNEPVLASPKVVEVFNSSMTTKSPRIRCYESDNTLFMNVYHKHNLLFNIDMSNPLLDNRFTYNTNQIGNKTFDLKGTLLRLQIEATNRSINSFQLPLNDKIFNFFDINKLKHDCNMYLNQLTLFLVTPPKTMTDPNEKNKILNYFHNDPLVGGHCGQKKLYAKIRSEYYWPNMTKDIAQFVRTCKICKLNKHKPYTKEPMIITETPQKPFDIVEIDTIGPLIKSHNGNTYAITIICQLTKYIVSIPIPNKQSKTIAKAIFENFILIYGPMRRAISDRGTEYKNETIEELFKLLNIEYKYSTAYHHQTVGTVERNHRNFNQYLRTYIQKDSPEWEDFIKYFSYCYNISFNATLDFKYTPFELVFNKKPNLPENLLDGHIVPLYNLDNYVKEAEFRLRNAWSQAVTMINKHKQTNKKYYDRNINELNVQINDLVYLKVEPYHKHSNTYSGPHKIIEIQYPNVTILDQNTQKTQLVHLNRLAKK